MAKKQGFFHTRNARVLKYVLLGTFWLLLLLIANYVNDSSNFTGLEYEQANYAFIFCGIPFGLLLWLLTSLALIFDIRAWWRGRKTSTS
jgi:hypothetical protein